MNGKLGGDESSQKDILNGIRAEVLKFTSRVNMSDEVAEVVPTDWPIKQIGQPYSLDFIQFYSFQSKPISPWHDIPLYPVKGVKDYIHMVIEIPRGTRAKNEVQAKSILNPLKQDNIGGKMRFFQNPYPFHYGCIPQTFSNPLEDDPIIGKVGDGDILDIIDISSITATVGAVIQVKIIGAVPLIDNGSTDWKIVTINVNDPLLDYYKDSNDLGEREKQIMEWFSFYKYPEVPTFGLDGKIQNKATALKVLDNSSAQWSNLMNGKVHTTEFGVNCTICPSNVKPEFQLTTDQANTVINNIWKQYLYQ
jgi:inorganic pyrophosphatase